MVRTRSRIIAGGMLRIGTPVQDYREEWGLLVKREDLACPPPGPPFSKTRGVYEHVRKRPEKLIGVLDTYHSQAGHAVARACQVLGKTCVNFYPEFKYEPGPRPPQIRAASLGAELIGLPAGRSAILWHAAKKATHSREGYMMPNALKLDESVTETCREARSTLETWKGTPPGVVLLPASSGTIAAGVIRGFIEAEVCPRFILHLGYSRSHGEVLSYVLKKAGVNADVNIVDENYSYKDEARKGPTPEWPCNSYYDLKAFRWWDREGREQNSGRGDALLWNVG